MHHGIRQPAVLKWSDTCVPGGTTASQKSRSAGVICNSIDCDKIIQRAQRFLLGNVPVGPLQKAVNSLYTIRAISTAPSSKMNRICFGSKYFMDPLRGDLCFPDRRSKQEKGIQGLFLLHLSASSFELSAFIVISPIPDPTRTRCAAPVPPAPCTFLQPRRICESRRC